MMKQAGASKRAVAHFTLDPRRRWSERFGGLIGRAELWRQLTALAAIAALINLSAVAYLLLFPPVVPVTATIDRSGTHAIAGYADRVASDDPRIVAPILRRVIADARAGAGRAVEGETLGARFIAPGSAAESTMRAHRTQLDNAGKAVDVETRNAGQVGGDKWRVEWLERRVSDATGRIEESAWEAEVRVAIRPAIGLASIDERNPLGVYVEEIAWRTFDPTRLAQARPRRQ